MTDIPRDVALYFRDSLRSGRAAALRDAEAFGEILFAVERLGGLLTSGAKKFGLGSFTREMVALAAKGALAQAAADSIGGVHVEFRVVYDLVRESRNSAFHEGAFARHLTSKSVELALLLEDALTTDMNRIGDYMVQGAVTASPWQPISFIRQIMLANSFSFLPVWMNVEGIERWSLVSDYGLACYLRTAGNSAERKARLVQPLEAAVRSGSIGLDRPFVCPPDCSVTDALQACDGRPVLIHGVAERDLLGIATPYDLL